MWPRDRHSKSPQAQTQTQKSSGCDDTKSNVKEKDFAPSDTFDLSEYLKDHKEKLMQRYGFEKSNTARYPRYYFINDNKSILIILQGDITRTKVDAIVNAANEHMTGGGGVDGIIHRAAGPELYNACRAHKQIVAGMRLPTGRSRILLSYNMSSTTHYIINTAGPIYSHYESGKCAQELKSCYKTALALANLYDLESIGFTAISCGIFGYPPQDGADVALRIVDTEAGRVPVIVFVLWDDHIYDTWVKQAEKLKFIPFDIKNPMLPPSRKPPNDNNQPKTPSTPSSNDGPPKSPPAFDIKVRDLSTADKTATTANENLQSALDRLPSVPHDTPDSQQTQSMEEEENNTTTNDNSLYPQHSLEMTSDNQDESKSYVNNQSEEKSVEETINKDPIDPTTTDDNPLSQNKVEATPVTQF